MDKASDFGSEDCRFESCHTRELILLEKNICMIFFICLLTPGKGKVFRGREGGGVLSQDLESNYNIYLINSYKYYLRLVKNSIIIFTQ